MRIILAIALGLLLISSCNGSSGVGVWNNQIPNPEQTPLRINASLYSLDNKGNVVYSPDLTAKLEVNYAKDGSDDVVIFNLKNVENMTYLYMKVDYPIQFSYKSTRFGTLFSNSYLGAIPYEPGKVDVVVQMFGENPKGFTGSGEACRIFFARRQGSGLSAADRQVADVSKLTTPIVYNINVTQDPDLTLSWVEKFPGDTNQNHHVDFADFGVIGANYNKSIATNPDKEPVDANANGKVDFADFGQVGAYYNNKITGFAVFTGNPPVTESRRFTFDGKDTYKIPDPTKTANGWYIYKVKIEWPVDQKIKVVPLDQNGNVLDKLGAEVDYSSEIIQPIPLPTVSDTKFRGARPAIGIQPQDGTVHIAQHYSTQGFRHIYFDYDKNAWVKDTVTGDLSEYILFPGVFCPVAESKKDIEIVTLGYSTKNKAFVFSVKDSDTQKFEDPMNILFDQVNSCDYFKFGFSQKDGAGIFAFAGDYKGTYGVYSFVVVPQPDTPPLLIGPNLVQKIDVGKVFSLGLVIEKSGGVRLSYIAGTYDAGANPPTIDTKLYTTYWAPPLDKNSWQTPVLVNMPSAEENPIRIDTALNPNGFESIVMTTAKPYKVPIINYTVYTTHIYHFLRNSDSDPITWGTPIVSGGVATEGMPPSSLNLTLPGLTLTHAFPNSGTGGRLIAGEYQINTPITWDGMTPKLGTPSVSGLLANFKFTGTGWTAGANVTNNATVAPSIVYNHVWNKYCLVYLNAALQPEELLEDTEKIEGDLIYKTIDP